MANAADDGLLDKLERALLPTRTLHIRDQNTAQDVHTTSAEKSGVENEDVEMPSRIEREGTVNEGGHSTTKNKPVMAKNIEEATLQDTQNTSETTKTFSPIHKTTMQSSPPKLHNNKDSHKQPSQSPSDNQSKGEHQETNTSTPISFFDNKSATTNEPRSNNITPTFLKRKTREGDEEGSVDTLNSAADVLKFITSENIVRDQISKRSLTLLVAYIQTKIR